MKKFDAMKMFLTKRQRFEHTYFFYTLLLNKGFVSAQILHALENQLVPAI